MAWHPAEADTSAFVAQCPIEIYNLANERDLWPSLGWQNNVGSWEWFPLLWMPPWPKWRTIHICKDDVTLNCVTDWTYLALRSNIKLFGVPLALLIHAWMNTGQCPEFAMWPDSSNTSLVALCIMTTRSKTQGRALWANRQTQMLSHRGHLSIPRRRTFNSSWPWGSAWRPPDPSEAKGDCESGQSQSPGGRSVKLAGYSISDIGHSNVQCQNRDIRGVKLAGYSIGAVHFSSGEPQDRLIGRQFWIID